MKMNSSRRRLTRRLLLGALPLVLAAAPLRADELDKAAQTSASPVTSTSAPSSDDTTSLIQTLKEQIADLDQKVRILERKDEIGQEDKAAKAEVTPKITVDNKGIAFTSADQKFNLQIHGLLQVDSRDFIDGNGINNHDSLLLRRARFPIITGKLYDNWEYQFTPEFGGGSSSGSSTVSVLDAFVNAHYWDQFQVQAGKFKEPLGLEILQADANRLFAETSLVSNLVPNRDVGVQIWGTGWDKAITYQAGVFNGGTDGNSAGFNADYDNNREVVARLIFQPFRLTDINELKGFGFGAATSYGAENGNTTSTGLTSGFVTDGQQTFFKYRADAGAGNTTVADGDHWRLIPQGFYYYGPFGLLGEWAIDNQEVKSVKTTGGALVQRGRIQNQAWQVTSSYVLTGEDASYAGVTPSKPFNLSTGDWGAFELVGRYGELNIGADAFNGTTTTATGTSFADANQARRAAAFGFGLNWYLNKNIRVLTDFMQTDFAGGNQSKGTVTGQNESVIITRLQLAF